MNLISAVALSPWLILESALDTICAAAMADVDVVAAHAAPAHGKQGGDFSVVGDTAVVGLRGPIFQDQTYLNGLMAFCFGGTILEAFKESLVKAAEDPTTSRIVLDINSPGGQAAGIEEAAKLVGEVRSQKKVISFIDNVAASAAYWPAAASDEIILSGQTSQVGSLGIVLTMKDARGRDAANGVKTYEIVSEQSPFKRVDPSTEEGRAVLQAWANTMGGIFVESVAGYRGKKVEDVLRDFGRGDMVFAEEAVRVGMADGIMTRKELFRSFRTAKGNNSGGLAAQKQQGGRMEGQITQQDLTAAEAKGRTDERKRIFDILSLPEAKGREEVTQQLVAVENMTAEMAKPILAKVPIAGDPLAQAMAGVKNPNVGAEGGDPEVSAADLVKQITSWSSPKGAN